MSSTDAKIRLPHAIEVALDATGLAWDATSGTKHIKIWLAGRMVAVCPRVRANEPIAERNVVAQIRRAARQVFDRVRA